MWSVVQLGGGESERTPRARNTVPTSRSKHAMCVGQDGFFYMLGGKSANLPMKDLWRFDPVKNQWAEVQTRGGTAPPSLQEHTVVSWKSKLYVFGGEIGFASTGETPLWLFDIQTHNGRFSVTGVWRKHSAQGPQPSGRRGHSSVVYNGAMHLYGGYQDLKGSSSELWSFHFDTETWQLVSSKVKGSCGEVPPARHNHSAVVHDGAMWVYGGMTDLRERNDFWRYDFVNQHWNKIKMPKGTGPRELHSHAAVFANQCMWIFGGEKSGKPSNDLWRYHFASDAWDKIQAEGVLPNPRCRHVALANPELHKWADKVIDDMVGSKVARLPPKSQSMMTFGDRSRASFKIHPMNRLSLMGCSTLRNAQSDEDDDSIDAVKAYLAAYNASNNKSLRDRLSKSRLVRSISSGNYNITSSGRQKEELERLLEESRHNTPQVQQKYRNESMQKSSSSEAVLESDGETSTPVHMRRDHSCRENDFINTVTARQHRTRPLSEIIAASHQMEVLHQREQARPLRLSPPPANSRPSRRMHASKSMNFPHTGESNSILHKAGFCSSSCHCSSRIVDNPMGGDSGRCDRSEGSEGSELDLIGFSNTAQTTQYGPLTHISDLESSDTDGESGVVISRRKEDLLVELRKNTAPLSRSTANELERIRSSRFTSFSTLSELTNMVSQGRSGMPHSVSHCSGYYSFIEDDPDVVAFLRNGHMSRPEHGGEHELVELSTFSDAAAPQPGIAVVLKERATASVRTAEPTQENSSTIATTRLGGIPSRAIQVIKEESVQGSPIRISSESWSLHNEGEEDEDDDEDNERDDKSDTTTETDSQTTPSPNSHSFPSNSNRPHSPSYHGRGRYSPASSNKFQVHDWQLCLYVFGGQEASTPGMYRSPMTVWQLFV
ncbi:uncharacterized protein LOC100902573 [Galendromus occidentalis]|uniref:Uncharacterized protein LOC100902573 n=1 Tax=Galendromus occidentalis TaxID=34638 RepID=A0AAJ7SHY3_9ACAR|nr:uncharacterized protein LOC100902573 [Galendromus occidentalis]